MTKMPSITGEQLSVTIIGGGIGGLVCAISIACLCEEVGEQPRIALYEQAAAYKEIGAGVHIGVNAAKILHRIGVGKAINSIAALPNDVWLSYRRYDSGKEILTTSSNDKGEVRQLPVHRAELLALLHDYVLDKNIATLHTDKRCVSVTSTSSGVTANFQDGTRINSDLIIGCDGIHSVVREQFEKDKPKYSGRIAYRGLVPIEKVQDFWPIKETLSASWLGRDRHFLIFPVCQNKKLNVVAFASKSEQELGDLKESWTSTADRSEVEKDFKDFDPTIRRIISSMDQQVGKWRLNDRNPLAQWTFLHGKVVLVGDAAHAMLPHQGAGAGQSIEDGYILGRAIADALLESRTTQLDLEKWTKVYQDVRLPRAQKAQTSARACGFVYQQQGPMFEGKSYEENLPKVFEQLQGRMKWIWTGDIDDEYSLVRDAALRDT